LSADQQNDNPKPPFHVEDGIPIFDRLSEVEREQAESKKRDKEYKDKQLSLDRKMVLFTFLLVICTAVVGVINAWQARIASRSAKAAESAATTASNTLIEIKTSSTDTHELAVQAKNQADRTKDVADRALDQAKATNLLAAQAKRQADIARDAMNSTIEASKLDGRAWFGVSDFEILQYDPSDTKKPFRFQISFRNTGKTPARQINESGIFQVYDSRLSGPTDADWKTFLGYFSQSKERYVAAPNATRKAIFDSSMDAATHEFIVRNYPAIKQGTQFLYYFGQATYLDINDRPHTTKFCLVLAQPETKQLAHCGKGNEMD